MFFVCAKGLYAQGASTQGTDFWLTFGSNMSNSANSVDLQIRIVGSETAATGTIRFTALTGAASTVTFSVAAGEVFTYGLNTTQKQAAYNTTAGASNYSIHITSSSPVAVYALNQTSATTDATNVLPVAALGNEYYHISYQPESRPTSNECLACPHVDAYAVVATQNNTTIFNNPISPTILNEGDVYYHTSYNDMTGSHVTADKPIAFFAMCRSTFIPATQTTSREHLFQQLAPVHTWGKNFFVPASHLGKDRIRIVASQNGTNISQSGGSIQAVTGGQTTLTNLNAGQWVELEISLANKGCYIQADKPVGICAFLTTDQYNGGGGSDPAQAWLPAIEQTVKSALIAPFRPAGTTNLVAHYALIVTPTNTKTGTMVSIGGATAATLSGGTWYDHSSNYSFYSMPLTNTASSYFFTNPAALIVMGYGIGTIESYYYLASSAMRSLDAAFYVNNVHYQDLDGDVLCDTTVNFRATLQNAASTSGFLRWYIDGIEETSKTDILEWSKVLSVGNHTVRIDVVDVDNNITTLSSTFHVGVAYSKTINESICFGKLYDKHGFNIMPTQAGIVITDSLVTQTIHGCDSIIRLNLTVNPTYDDTIRCDICGSGSCEDFPNSYSGSPLINSPIDMDIYTYTRSKTPCDCDSIITWQLSIHSVWDYTVNTAICLGARYVGFGFDTVPTQAGVITDVHYHKTRHGCDSIVRLNLTVRPSYNDTIRETICLGTTYSENGFNETPPTSGIFYYNRKFYTERFYCDSIITLELTVSPTLVTIDTAVCQHEIYDAHGFTIPTSNTGFYTYTHNNVTANGCDSTTVLNLTVNPVFAKDTFATIYEDEFYHIGNYKYNIPGAHTAYLQTREGCDSIINLNLWVIYYPPEITAFTPFNKDGINDYFMAGFKVQIFNRYGTLIYETKTPEQQALGWDGRNSKGQEVEPGMYFYILYNSSEQPRIKSSVEVLQR
jgi:hypothetical protein